MVEIYGNVNLLVFIGDDLCNFFCALVWGALILESVFCMVGVPCYFESK